MSFKVTFTLHVARVERWIRDVKRDYLDGAKIKIVGLDCEFTTSREGRENQRAATLQLCVAHETLVYQILFADALPRALIEFLAPTRLERLFFRGTRVKMRVNFTSHPHVTTYTPRQFNCEKTPFKIFSLCIIFCLESQKLHKYFSLCLIIF